MSKASPTVIREMGRHNAGHKWARFGPWIGHNANYEPGALSKTFIDFQRRNSLLIVVIQ